MSLALSKHKLDSWKTPKPTHWRKLDPHKWLARSWHTFGRTIENANLWLQTFWSNSGLWWFKVVFQNTTVFLLYLFRRNYAFKQININLQGLPNINHRTLPTFSPRVQGQAALGFLHVRSLQPVSSYRVKDNWRNFICELKLWTGYHCSDTTCITSTALVLV